MSKARNNVNKKGSPRNAHSVLFSMQHSFQGKKACPLCSYKKHEIDYKDIPLLKKFISDGGRILSRRLTHVCAKHQRIIVKQIKIARYLAFIFFCD